METKLKNLSTEFTLQQWIPKKKYAYVSDFFDEYKDFIDDFDVVILYSKKGKGKSEVGYRMCEKIIEDMSGNIVYGRLQMLEKQNAYHELFKTFLTRGWEPQKLKGFSGRDYIGFNNVPLLRLINISSYQSVRGAVAEGFYIYKDGAEWKSITPRDENFKNVNARQLTPKLIWFDEINALNFPPNFEVQFLQMLDTIGRGHKYKLFCSGNNETAINNPILSIFQLKFNWDFSGIQLAYRIVHGVKVLGIQLGIDAFDEEKNPMTIAERLAIGTAMYETYFVGISNLNGQQNIINLKEDYEVKNTIMYWAEEDRVYRISYAKINDKINNISVNNGIIIEAVSNTFENVYEHDVPFYTVSKISNDLFKDVIWLDKELGESIITDLAEWMKKRKLFFTTFDGLRDLQASFRKFNYRYQKGQNEW